MRNAADREWWDDKTGYLGHISINIGNLQKTLNPYTQLFQKLVAVPEDLKGEEAREYAFFKIGYVVAIISHFSWALTFYLNGLWSMAVYNLVVTGLFAIGAYIWRLERFPRGLIISLWLIAIPLHAVLGTLFAGFETLFWAAPLISAIVVLTSPKFSWSSSVIVSVVAVIAACTLGLVTYFVAPIHPLSVGSNLYLFATNFIGIFGALTMFVGLNQFIAHTAEAKLTVEFERAENLLRNILPDQIAVRLKDGERVIANNHNSVSVIFADIVDFTAASSNLSPSELVETLNTVFSEFDTLAENHGAEKIKTIDDAYMVVVGAPDAQDNHAERAVNLAFDMQQAATDLSGKTHFDVRLRIGVNSGAVVAGVIGKRKFTYDLWGDVVNVASRMENHGQPGQIFTTEATAKLLPDGFAVKSEGMREIKGKGPTQVFSISRV